MKADIAKVKASTNVFIPADKLSLSPKECKKLLKNIITKT